MRFPLLAFYAACSIVYNTKNVGSAHLHLDEREYVNINKKGVQVPNWIASTEQIDRICSHQINQPMFSYGLPLPPLGGDSARSLAGFSQAYLISQRYFSFTVNQQ